MEKIKKYWRAVLSGVLVLIMLVSAVYIGYYYYGTYKQHKRDASLRDLYSRLDPEDDIVLPIPEPSVATQAPEQPTEEEPTETDIPLVQKNRERMAPFLEINPDFVAMITIPGIDMLLPVVQCGDNEKYLNTSFEGESEKRGTLFLDYQNQDSFMDKNNIIYGHYMKDGTMFHDLHKYKQAETFENASVIKVESLYGTSLWMVFAAYTCEPMYRYYHTDYPEDEFQDVLDEMKRRSLFNTEIEVTPDDKILTLSTCDYDFEDARFAIHARLLRKGEPLPAVYHAVQNPDRQAYNVPLQQRFTSLAANGISGFQHPQTNFLYFYQYGEGGIERYVGNLYNLQGPYPAYTGSINRERVSRVAAGTGFPARREYYLVSGGLNGDEPGLYLLRASSPTEPFTLVSCKPVTPEGEDAQWPVLCTDNEGHVTLLYTLADDEWETLYALSLHGGEEPVFIAAAKPGAGLRPVGMIEHENGSLLLWKEGNVLRSLYTMVNYPEEEGNLQFIYHRPNKRWVAITEHKGALRSEPIELDTLVPSTEPSPEPTVVPYFKQESENLMMP